MVFMVAVKWHKPPQSSERTTEYLYCLQITSSSLCLYGSTSSSMD